MFKTALGGGPGTLGGDDRQGPASVSGDPAELFAVSLRISGRLGCTHPALAEFLIGAGLDVLDLPVGLAPRALRDIRAGQAVGRFTAAHAEVALSAVAGGLLGLLRLHQRSPDEIDASAVDQFAEAALRMLGVPDEDVARILTVQLPPIDGW